MLRYYCTNTKEQETILYTTTPCYDILLDDAETNTGKAITMKACEIFNCYVDIFKLKSNDLLFLMTDWHESVNRHACLGKNA